MKIVLIAFAVLALLLLLGWLGLRVKPRPLPAFAGNSPVLETVPLPEGLPAPVERFYRQVYGDRVPVIESAVISGRAVMSPVGGVKIPARFRFYHRAGQDYRHFFEMTWFGRTFGTGNEHYLDGKSRLTLPMGLSDEGPQVDQAANLSMWAEYVWLPAVLITDPRVRWEPVDENTALLIVPFGDGEQTFVARFDPDSGRLRMLKSMRYKDSKSVDEDSVAQRIVELEHGQRLRDTGHRRRSPGSTRGSRGQSSPSKMWFSTQMSARSSTRAVSK